MLDTLQQQWHSDHDADDGVRQSISQPSYSINRVSEQTYHALTCQFYKNLFETARTKNMRNCVNPVAREQEEMCMCVFIYQEGSEVLLYALKKCFVDVVCCCCRYFWLIVSYCCVECNACLISFIHLLTHIKCCVAICVHWITPK